MRTLLKQAITTTAAAAALALVTAPAQAQKHPGESGGAKLSWGPAPDVFPKGAKMAVESGNPMASGVFVVRLSLPKGYKIPPHFHPTDEHVTIHSGTFLVGMGDVLDASKTMKMAATDTGTIPAKQHHFAMASTPVVLSIRADGPFAMTYVNPADDPRKK
jgi:quercetin dioxygenase-like cupin family protein